MTMQEPPPYCARKDDLRIEHNALGHAVRVFVGPMEVTHLVARVQTNITMAGTLTEVVLCSRSSAAVAAGARP